MSQPLVGIDHVERRSRVRIASVWQRGITLHALYRDGTIRSWALDDAATSRHIQMGAMIEWELPREYGAPERLLWQIDDSANVRGILVSPRLARPRQSSAANLQMGAIYAAFGGLCAALLAYNLAMWAALRHRFQLAYCAMVVALGAYTCTSSGALAWWLPDIANTDRIRLNYLFIACAAAAALFFARSFFETELAGSRIPRAANRMTGLLALATAAFVLLAPWRIALLDTLVSLSFAAILPLIIPIVWRARQRRSPHLWLFATAWAVPLLFACLRIASGLGIIRPDFWIDNSTILAMSFEAVMSTVAIAYRIRLLTKERDEARAQELAARLLADTDPLTGLLNRRAFLVRAMAVKGELTLFLADLDHFKQVNETIGHDGGDEVLRVFARTLRTTVPADALVARIGGEEFAIAQPSGEALNPDELLAWIRAARMPFDLSITASIGSCTGPLTSEGDWKRLYHNADRALFAAKSAGRDRARRSERIAAAA
ncbi:GGDEF domain-containing protein [Stakelama sp. CBK3Z-3]|uniref:diguanylate cyclase n=2 Tax=Stakelama flava TaxID=2860338 RepID=A0ABS6XHW2_9SPHN|nr:GGDEF domain-containing protein [Stakelama flava]